MRQLAPVCINANYKADTSTVNMPKCTKSRNFVFTLNNPDNWPGAIPETTEDTNTNTGTRVVKKCIRYFAYAEEVAPSTGTKHLQGFIVMSSSTTTSAVKKHFPHAFVEQMYGRLQDSEKYCSKTGNDLKEFGDRPMTSKDKGQSQIDRWRNVSELAQASNWQQLNEEEPMIFLLHNRKLQQAASLLKEIPLHINELQNYWIHGPPGTGKSSGVRLHFNESEDDLMIVCPSVYDKQQSKWWSLYAGQPNVLIDDFEKSYSGKLQLKRWADRYPFQAEIKGGDLGLIRPRRIIVTSNYSIQECFPACPDTGNNSACEAIQRRFTEVHKQAVISDTPGAYDVFKLDPRPFEPTFPDAFKELMAAQVRLATEQQAKRKIVDETDNSKKSKFSE